MSSGRSSTFAELSVDKVTKLCFDKFQLLPKTGKPNKNEWTILAGIILHNNQTGNSQVISLGCGTKCIGKSKLCSQGLILNDSHAEVMARRGLLRYLYHQLKEASKQEADNPSIFVWMPEKRKFQLKDELSLHFFSTQTPCGDACIIKAKESEKFIDEPLSKRNKIDESCEGSLVTTVYTGAKLIGSNQSDAMAQHVGAVRTKPGRGEPTLSMSCSDKLARWQIMGVQGALIAYLITKPIYFDTLNFWGENDFTSLERAIWKRFENNEYDNTKYTLLTPKIRIIHEPDFPHAQESKKKPSPNGIVWCDIPNNMNPYEISVNGKRQGTTIKKLQAPESALKISKHFLFREFLNIIKLKPDLFLHEENLELKTYLDCKYLANDYQNAWSAVKIHYFKQWSQKPNDILRFCVKTMLNKDENKT